MIRVLLETLGLFLLPFLLFGLLLVARRRRLLAVEHWSAPAAWLTAAGLLIVLGSFLYSGLVVERPRGGFEPTHVEDGRVVPGRFR